MTDPHPPPLRALQEDGHLAQTSVKEDTLSRRGTSVARDNRLATSVQTHFFDSGSAAAVGRQERWTQLLFVWLAKGGRNGGNTSRAPVARSPSCAEQRTGEATYARGRKCENALELRGRAPAEFPGQAMHGALRAAGAREVGLCPDEIEHTGQQETAFWARWGAHRERVDASA